MITKLTIANLKNVTRTVDLERINLVVGQNSTGKSAIIDGVKLSLLGFHPSLGRKPSLTFQLATPGSSMMTVSTNDRTINWKRNAKGVISVDGLEGLDMPSVMLDLNEWLALSGPQKIQYVIEHSGQVLGDAVTKVDELIQQCSRISAEAAKLDRKDTGKFLKDLMVLAKSNKQAATAELETIQGAINQELLSGDKPPENPEKELKALNALIEQLQKDQAKATGTKAALEKQQQTENARLAKLQTPVRPVQEIERELNTYKPQVEQWAKSMASLDASAKELRKKITAIPLAEKRTLASRLLAVFEAAVKHGACETCGAVILGPTLQKMRDESDAQVKELESLQEVVDGHQSVLDEFDMDRAAVAESLAEAQSQIKRLEQELQHATARDQQLAECLLRIAQAKEQLTALVVPALDPALLTKRDELTKAQREYIAWKGTERERSKALELRTEKDKSLEVAKELITAVKSSEEELMKKVIGPLLDRANALVKPVLGMELGYVDGEFVLGKGILKTISGSEELIVYAGLQLALTPLLQDRILVIDELGRLDHDRLNLLLIWVDALIEDKTISQFIGVLPGAVPTLETVVNIIQCGQ